jgi:glycosyltransferase involved in cell wall biosynthesis
MRRFAEHIMRATTKHDGGHARIAIVRHSSYPEDMHVRRDALALRDAGFDVDLICDQKPGKRMIERVDGITVVRIPPHHKRGGVGRYLFEYTAFPLAAAAILALRSARRRYAWIEINNMPDWLVLAAIVPKLLGARVVLYSREDMVRLLASDHELSSRHPMVRLFRALQQTCCRFVDRVITTQDLARRDLIDQGIPADKIVAVPNAPDEEAFLARVPETRIVTPRLPHTSTSFRLVTHGTLVKRYGIETLIQAVHLLRDTIPGLHLEIIGDGEYRSALEALVERLELRQHVTFAGFLPEYEQVAPKLLDADLGIVPIWTDFQLCNKLVDYLLLGIPAITSESRVLRTYLDDEAVHFVPPKNDVALADGILLLYREPGRRAALAAAGKAAYLKHFSWDQARHQYLALYTEIDHCLPVPSSHDRRQIRPLERSTA